MVTLTSQADANVEARFELGALQEQIRHVRRAFMAFWRLTPWGRQRREGTKRAKRNRKDTSYIYALEVSPQGMVHAHVLIFGEYLPQNLIQAAWTKAMGELARVDVRTVDPKGGVAAAIQEVLKYVTKTEKGTRTRIWRAAMVELAMRHLHRTAIGGALRLIKVTEANIDEIGMEDLHATHELACECCGVVGAWRWTGIVDPGIVVENGGFGTLQHALPARRRIT